MSTTIINLANIQDLTDKILAENANANLGNNQAKLMLLSNQNLNNLVRDLLNTTRDNSIKRRMQYIIDFVQKNYTNIYDDFRNNYFIQKTRHQYEKMREFLNYLLFLNIESVGPVCCIYLPGNKASNADTKPIDDLVQELKDLDDDISTQTRGASVQNQSFMSAVSQPSQGPQQNIPISNTNQPNLLSISGNLLIDASKPVNQNITHFNDYVIQQWTNKSVIESDALTDLTDLYPNILSNDYLSKIANYNNIVANNLILSSQVSANLNDLLLPIPNTTNIAPNANQAPLAQKTQETIKNLQANGFDIATKNLSNDFVLFKQDKDSEVKGEGTYIIPEDMKNPFTAKWDNNIAKFRVKRKSERFVAETIYDIYQIINSVRKRYVKPIDNLITKTYIRR